jgi:hypothetical protein
MNLINIGVRMSIKNLSTLLTLWSNEIESAAVSSIINHLKPTGYVMYQQVKHSTIVHSAHTVFMRFVLI